MKIALLSDVHGNAVALEAVVQDIWKRQVDKILVLGDICFRGPEPKESLRIVQSLDAEVIKGNADEWVVRGIHHGEVPEQAFDIMNQEREWTLSKLNNEEINYLKELPETMSFSAGNLNIFAFHATPNSLFEVIPPDAPDNTFSEKMFSTTDADIYFYGHIHKAYIRYVNGKTVVNLGSVGMPFDGVKKASYALLEIEDNNFQTSIIKVPYDVDKVIQQVQNSDYPNKDFLCQVLVKAQV